MDRTPTPHVEHFIKDVGIAAAYEKVDNLRLNAVDIKEDIIAHMKRRLAMALVDYLFVNNCIKFTENDDGLHTTLTAEVTVKAEQKTFQDYLASHDNTLELRILSENLKELRELYARKNVSESVDDINERYAEKSFKLLQDRIEQLVREGAR